MTTQVPPLNYKAARKFARNFKSKSHRRTPSNVQGISMDDRILLEQLFHMYDQHQKFPTVKIKNITGEGGGQPQALQLPLFIDIIMNLGFGFVHASSRPNYASLVSEMKNTIRVLGLYLFHQMEATFPVDHDDEYQNHREPFDQILKENAVHFRMPRDIPSVERYEEMFNIRDADIIHLINQEFVRQQQRRRPLYDPWVLGRALLHKFGHFCANNQVMFVKADKGAGIVMCTIQQYMREVERHLLNPNVYRMVTQTEYATAMSALQKHIVNFDEDCSNTLPIKLRELIPFPEYKYKPASFKILWKLHKDRVAETNNFPGRPICSTVNSMTRGISKVLNIYLTEIMTHCKEIILDSLQLLNLLQVDLAPLLRNDRNNLYYLISCDMKDMFTVFKHEDIQDAVAYYYNLYNNGQFYFPLPIHLIQRLVHIVLNDNFLTVNASYGHRKSLFRSGAARPPRTSTGNFDNINGRYFQMMTGTFMGQSSATLLCNLTASYLVNKRMNSSIPKEMNQEMKIIFHVRMLDDMFMVVEDRTRHLTYSPPDEHLLSQQPKRFVIYANRDVADSPHLVEEQYNNGHEIDPLELFLIQHFTMEYITLRVDYHPHKLPFLDLQIQIMPGAPITEQTIKTTIWRKPQSVFIPINYKSNHPPGHLKSIVYGEAMRIVRSCSEPQDRKHHMHLMYRAYESAQYPIRLLIQLKTKIDAIERNNELFKPKSLLSQQMLYFKMGPWEYAQHFGLADFPAEFQQYKIPRPLAHAPHTIYTTSTYDHRFKHLSYNFIQMIKDRGERYLTGTANQFVHLLNIKPSYRVNRRMQLESITAFVNTNSLHFALGRLQG